MKTTRREDIKQLIISNYRRLQVLKQQQALAGRSVDPGIVLEIEDIETTIADLQKKLEALVDKEAVRQRDDSMDPQTVKALSETAVGILTIFLTRTGETTAQRTGEDLYETLKVHFEQNPAAQESLLDLEQMPTDDDYQAALRGKLRKLMREDASFAEQIKQLMGKTWDTDAGKTIINQQAGDNAKQIGQIFGNVKF